MNILKHLKELSPIKAFTSVQFSSIDVDDSGYVHVTFMVKKVEKMPCGTPFQKMGDKPFLNSKKSLKSKCLLMSMV
jgi:hypothetical protein